MGATRLASGHFSAASSRVGKEAINKGSQTALITCLSVSLCLNAPTRDASPPLVFAFLLAPNATTKRYHQTLALMGATRLASGHFSAASSRVGKEAINKGSQTALITCLSVSLCLNAPTRDASPPLVFAFLLAPNATTKRYHQTLALMGATRLASGHFSAASSRVGKEAINKGSQKALITCLSGSLCLNAPTRDASPPLEVAFGD